MSNQKFSAAEREAFYQAHAGKCAYTRQLLDISSFHIDHVLPESLADDQAAFASAKSDLGLDAAFDLFGYENLLPVSPGANLQKGKVIFDPNHVRYYLALAASKKADVEAHLANIERRNVGGRALILLLQALQSGKLTASEVAKILEQHQDEPDQIFELLAGVTFADSEEEVNAIAKADIDSLRDRPVISSDQSLILHRGYAEEVEVRTCREYEQAIKDGYSASGTYAIKGASLFVHRAGLLNALERAAPAKTSFIDSPRVGVVDLHLLPFRLFPNLAEELPEEEQANTYLYKVANGSLVIQNVRQNMLVIAELEGMGQHLIEVARADFNGDGIEEILVFEYTWATHGTFGAGRTRILTRTNADALFEEVQLPSH
ncbi:hypothetical protein [Paraburkholderia sediminicola]|uniref:hypothetical protein n=1 Tax=Paraburkholderia sediminicola TaxID=458836 RepID=UPI0038BC7103